MKMGQRDSKLYAKWDLVGTATAPQEPVLKKKAREAVPLTRTGRLCDTRGRIPGALGNITSSLENFCLKICFTYSCARNTRSTYKLCSQGAHRLALKEASPETFKLACKTKATRYSLTVEHDCTEGVSVDKDLPGHETKATRGHALAKRACGRTEEHGSEQAHVYQ
jgi:hypothetical protein